MVENNENSSRSSAEIIPLAIRKLDRLRMGPPPRNLFDAPIGCTGNCRLFALYWLRALRVPILHDGILETVVDPEPYRIWRYHPRVIPHLAGYNLGDAAEHAFHWLLIDRLQRVMYAGNSRDVMEVLDFQKRGIIEPLSGEASASHRGTPLHIMGKKLSGSRKKLGRVLVPNYSVLHELEEWIDVNVPLI